MEPRWTPSPTPGCPINILVTSSQIEPSEALPPRVDRGSLTHSKSSYRCKVCLIFLFFFSFLFLFLYFLARNILVINRPLKLSQMSLKRQWNMIKLSEEGML